MRSRPLILATLLGALIATACSAVGPARMALPDALAGMPSQPFASLSGARRGEFSVDGQRVRFERSADRLSLFGVLTSDRTLLSFEVEPGSASARGRCEGRALQGTIGVLDAALRPLGVRCEIGSDVGGATLDLVERRSLAGTLAQREGHLQAGGVVLQIRSVHELQGSAFQLSQPAGYVLRHEGQPVAALDLSDRVPQLRRADTAPEVRRAALIAAVALGLLWDPATVSP